MSPLDPSLGQWRLDFRLPGLSGSSSSVEDLQLGPDGRVYAAGSFRDAAGQSTQGLAVWTGVRWAALGEGLSGSVNALAFDDDGHLWAGGDLAGEGTGNRLARWDGSAWTFVPGDIAGAVRDLVAIDERVVVVGDFSSVAGIATRGVAWVDDVGWYAVGTTGVDGQADTILATGDGFCIGGWFSAVDGVPADHVACWNGTSWSELGNGLPGAVMVLTRGPDRRIYAGGSMTFPIDPSRGEFGAGLAVLDGDRWALYAGGVDDGWISEIRALAWVNGDLYIGGSFNSVGRPKTPARNLARYDGTSWSEVGGGTLNRVGVFLGGEEGVNDMLVDRENALWVGGVFSGAGDSVASRVARLAAPHGGSFEALAPADVPILGVSGHVNALVVDRGKGLVAGGVFHGVGRSAATNVARLGKDGWELLGNGLSGTVFTVLARADGTVVAGGRSGRGRALLAAWDGATWSSLAQGLDGGVYALAEDAGGWLYAGGDFVTAGGVAAAHVARWNGSTWEALGSGLNDRVASLATDGAGRLLAAGFFTASGTAAVRGVAVWNGEAWAPLGGVNAPIDPRGYVSTIAVAGDQVFIGGTFRSIGGAPMARVAQWDGQSWRALGAGLGDPSGFALVSSLAPYRGGVFASGIFDRSGDTRLAGLAWWDGTAWHDLGGGISDLAEALVVKDDVLYAGGSMLEAGHGLVSSGLAAWDFHRD